MSSSRAFHHVALNDDEFTDAMAVRAAKKKSRKRNLQILLCVLITVIIIVILCLLFYFTLRKNEKKQRPHICISPDVCNSNLLDYIDDSVDPCEDFYTYSCGNWLTDNPLRGRDSVSTFSNLLVDNYRHLRSYLSQSVQPDDPVAIKKSKYIYSSCANVGFIDSNFKEHVRSYIKDAGGWRDIGITPDRGWNINKTLANDHYLGSSALFAINVAPDDLNSSKAVIRIGQAGLTLGTPQAYNSSDFDKLKKDIETILDKIDPTGSHYTLANDIAEFEKSLAAVSLTNTELRNVSALYNPMTLQRLQTLFYMDWVKYLNTLFSKAGVTAKFNLNTTVIVNTPTYFESINKIIAKNGPNLVKYAKWHLLSHEYAFATAPLKSSWTIVHEKKFPKSFKLSEAASFTCVEIAESVMPFAVARPFVDELITDSTVDKVNETINEIEEAFLDNLLEKNWLDNVTKRQCMNKVNAITRQIAYPDFIKVDSKLDQFYERLQIDSSLNHFQIGDASRIFLYYQKLSAFTKPIDKSKWFTPPTQVNAYYAPEFNQFVFLAGILRPPYFATNYPPFLLYGSIGSVIGHELTHGFDDQGQQYNKDGNRIQWWTDQSIANFKARTECFVEQYGNYSLQGFKIDGRLTLGENIADNGGVRAAFQAYKNVMNGTSEDQALIRGHTVDQLFFVAFAQLWCSQYSDKRLKKSVQTDPHSPGKFRALGSMVNNVEFATAFNCSSRSKMNPNNKCLLW